jgi:hypothetical protein
MSSSIGDGSHGFGVGAGFPYEEAAEQVQSPDSGTKESHSSAEEHSGGGVSDGQAQPSGRSARKPPRISTDIFTKPPRLWTDADMGKEDPYSPTTPAEEVMRQYADPDNLPGPTGNSTIHHSGATQEWTHFGSVEVPSPLVMHYLEVRRHMARAEPGQKYLAVVENRPDMKTKVLPYLAADPKFRLRPKAVALSGEKKAAVYFPVDQAAFTSSGGLHSAATIAAHELAHAARITLNPQTGTPDFPPKVPHPNWTDSEERPAIKVENAVAKANGELGERDTHHGAGSFFTSGIRSTTPVDPQQKSVIERFEPELREQSALMDKSKNVPGDLDKPIPAERLKTAAMARDYLEIYGNMPAIKSMMSSGKSLDEIATDLRLPNRQKEFIKKMFSPPPQP